jgi:hypothetical protein
VFTFIFFMFNLPESTHSLQKAAGVMQYVGRHIFLGIELNVSNSEVGNCLILFQIRHKISIYSTVTLYRKSDMLHYGMHQSSFYLAC